MNPKLIQKQTYIVDNKKFKSLPAWVRQISEDLYGIDSEAKMFILPYELDKPVQEKIKELGGTLDEYRMAMEGLETRVLQIEYRLNNSKIAADPQFDQSTYILSFQILGEENRWEIDLPIESLIKGVELEGSDLIFTLDNGQVVTVPMNTLLIGVAKDNEVVKITGNQTVEDIKTFTESVYSSKDFVLKRGSRQSRLAMANNKLWLSGFDKDGEVVVMSDLDTKANKTDLEQLYGGKNLASPDLGGKEYLGNGVYRISNLNGVMVDYCIYTGEYELNGTTTSIGWISNNIINPTLLSGQLTTKYIYISGSKSVHDYNISLSLQQTPIISPTFSKGINGITYTFENQDIGRLYTAEIGSFTNYKFKIQLEKGSTATPFVVPAGVIPYIPEVKSEFDTKQDSLISGTNIKTLNGASLLGSGDVSMDVVDWPEPQLIQTVRCPTADNTTDLKYYEVTFDRIKMTGNNKQILNSNGDVIDTFKELRFVMRHYSKWGSSNARVTKWTLDNTFIEYMDAMVTHYFSMKASLGSITQEDLTDKSFNEFQASLNLDSYNRTSPQARWRGRLNLPTNTTVFIEFEVWKVR